MKLCILLGYKFLMRNLNYGVNQCISLYVISQNVELVRLAIQPFLKIETSGLDQIIFVKLYSDHFTNLGVIKHISGHVTRHKLFI